MPSAPRRGTSQSQKGSPELPGPFQRVTFTVPPEIAQMLDTAWRLHENLDGSLCRNKSNYIADLIARDTSIKKMTGTGPARRKRQS